MPFDGTDYYGPKVYRALDNGRNRIRSGWSGRGPRSHNDGVCAVVALSGASDDHETYKAAYLALLDAVKETGFSLGGVSEFNDSHSQAEVIAIFDRAIESVSDSILFVSP